MSSYDIAGNHRRQQSHLGPLLQPLMGTSPPPLTTHLMAQHMQQRAQQAGASPGPARTGKGRFPTPRSVSRPILVIAQQAAARQRDKWMPLPEDDDAEAEAAAAAVAALGTAGNSLVSSEGALLMGQQLSGTAGITDEALAAV